nr:MAG TPA: hypothetical protein [Caudoviricetes sp.]
MATPLGALQQPRPGVGGTARADPAPRPRPTRAARHHPPRMGSR